jgi:hypothetical protein
MHKGRPPTEKAENSGLHFSRLTNHNNNKAVCTLGLNEIKAISFCCVFLDFEVDFAKKLNFEEAFLK